MESIKYQASATSLTSSAAEQNTHWFVLKWKQLFERVDGIKYNPTSTKVGSETSWDKA